MPPMIQLVSLIFGIAYVVVGILGFIPLTVEGQLPGVQGPLAGNLLGLFAVNWLHSLTHLLIGVAGIAASRRVAAARTFATVVGIAYLGLFVLSFFYESTATLEGWLPLNAADDVLHLGSAVLLLAVLLTSRDRRRRAR